MTTRATKTDNANLKAKLDLRRRFLERYHRGSPPRVFDCCQGGGVIWSHLRRDFPVASYWGVDQKPKKGRLKIDSARVLDQPGWDFDVIDVDTYGSPWSHWNAIVRHLRHDVTVFLTIGLIRMGGGGQLDAEQKQILGITGLKVPPAIQGKLHGNATEYLLCEAEVHDTTIQELTEAESNGSARYLGIRMLKKSGAATLQTSCPVGNPS